MELLTFSISEVSKMLAEKKITSQELTESIFERIKKVEPKISAFVTLLKKSALKQAKDSDQRRSDGKILSKLDGIPIALKDLLCTKGVETTASSNILKGFVPPYNATVVNLLEQAGAVIVGKTNLDAFAHGSSTENSDFKTTKNPWDTSRVPGGSSGGSAAAVAADECLGAIGTDTGGSIRQPASLCSVVGLKPTYGRVSRYGVIAMASSLDVVGPIAKTTEDAALILEIIAGHDKLDATTLNVPVPKYSENLDKDIKGLKIGIPKEYFATGMDEDVEKVIRDTIEKMKKMGAEIYEISLPHSDYALATYYILQPAEVSSNLSRYDGIKYGFSTLRDNKNQALEDVYFKSRGEGFGAEAKRRIMLGTYVLSAGYYDAYYRKALKLRTLVKNDFERVFDKSANGVDVIVTPVSPTPAFKIGEKSDDPVKMYLSDIYTVPINPAGVPAISTPVGFVSRDGKKLPVGLQIIGPVLGEQIILNVSHQLEQNLSIKDKPEL
ncbi:MAG: Asp-tRNA(Asn)/Glu-tRNA(Gln) amidotransferase subunit GatA [Candidatus Berkelbacteria bacterium]|nr:Asp-tRNA(Asn)/Glu-tRNA(Gln) amidotransferase subunit GatA [Candidatus Berkelbacteria bacterium]